MFVLAFRYKKNQAVRTIAIRANPPMLTPTMVPTFFEDDVAPTTEGSEVEVELEVGIDFEEDIGTMLLLEVGEVVDKTHDVSLPARTKNRFETSLYDSSGILALMRYHP